MKKKIMLIGETGSGKSSLVRVLSDGKFVSRRAMSIEFHGLFIITPGEFLENRYFYRSLITAGADSKIILFLQDATRTVSIYPPQFALSFNRRLIGVITKIDLPNARLERAERFLRTAGANEIIQVSTKEGDGLESLYKLLL